MIAYRSDLEDGGQQANSKDPPAKLSDEPWYSGASGSASSLQTTSAEPIVNRATDKRSRWFAAWCRETRMFVQITAMHGVKRMWESRAWSKLFWSVWVIVLFGLMTQQVTLIVLNYFGKPILSEITFVPAEDGLAFPKVTICNYNAVRKSYVDKINATGDFSLRLARYMMLANSDVLSIFGGNDESTLADDDAELQLYKKNHPGFTINSFYHAAGFACEDILKMCSFAGRQFNCCDYSTAVLSELGLCQELNLQGSPFAWMRKQTEATEAAGLQIVLDAHLEEILDVSLPTDKVFNTQFENGFKFYLEEPETTTSKSSQGITVSPGDIVYTSVALTTHQLLDTRNWGSCIREWPEGYNMTNGEPYQSTDCQAKCKANFFYDRCTCAPFMYNIDEYYRACTPVEVFRCVRDNIVVDYNTTTEDYEFPECLECVSECDRLQFDTYNSYGRGFADDAVNALMRHNPAWSADHIKTNFLSMNVFFRDMGFTSYVQVQDATITGTLSDMGGTMGLFLGMSVLTVVESIIYLAKVLWLTVCCPRKRHVAETECDNRKEKVETRDAVRGLRFLGVEQLENACRLGATTTAEKHGVIELRISVEELRRQLAMQGDAVVHGHLVHRPTNTYNNDRFLAVPVSQKF